MYIEVCVEVEPVETVACCPPMTRAALSSQQAKQVSLLLKALADPVRLLSLVASHADSEACVCDLTDAFELSQPTIRALSHR